MPLRGGRCPDATSKEKEKIEEYEEEPIVEEFEEGSWEEDEEFEEESWDEDEDWDIDEEDEDW